MQPVVTALAFRSVTKRFRNGRVALNDVTWSVAEGSRTCLLGPNGAGKSTSIRILEGALQPTAGSAELLGEPVDGPGYAAARMRTGIVPQGPGMYPDLTTREYLRIAADLYETRAERAIETFGLSEHLRTRLSELSGGYQRRVVLAGALVAEPDVLLLDEPTVGLDPKASHEVHAYLREVTAGRTVLLCTHNLTEAEALCEDVIILREGRVVVQGRLNELRRGTRSRLRLAVHQGPEVLAARLNGFGPLRVDGRRVLLDVADPEREAPRVLRALLDAGLDVYECTPLQASLEELFLEAVG